MKQLVSKTEIPQLMTKLKEMEKNLDKIGSWEFEPRTETFKIMKELRTQIKETCAQLVSQTDTKPLYDNDMEIQLLLSYDETNVKKGRAFELQLLSRYETIAKKEKNIYRALRYFYENGCSFAKDLEKALDISKGTAHRVIERLVDTGFIEALTKTHIPAKYGKKTSIYGVQDVTTKEINQAISRDVKYSSRSLRFVDIIYQRTLTDVDRDSIQMDKIMRIAKAYGNSSGFHYTDIARFVANKYQLSGVKVWRTS